MVPEQPEIAPLRDRLARDVQPGQIVVLVLTAVALVFACAIGGGSVAGLRREVGQLGLERGEVFRVVARAGEPVLAAAIRDALKLRHKIRRIVGAEVVRAVVRCRHPLGLDVRALDTDHRDRRRALVHRRAPSVVPHDDQPRRRLRVDRAEETVDRDRRFDRLEVAAPRVAGVCLDVVDRLYGIALSADLHGLGSSFRNAGRSVCGFRAGCNRKSPLNFRSGIPPAVQSLPFRVDPYRHMGHFRRLCLECLTRNDERSRPTSRTKTSRS